MTGAGHQYVVRKHALDVAWMTSRVTFLLGCFFSSILDLRIGGSVTAGDICLALSLIFLVLARLALRAAESTPAARLPTQTFALALMLILAVLLSMFRSQAPASSAAVGIRIFYVVLILPWQVHHLNPTSAALKRTFTYFAAGCTICAAGTLYQARFGATSIPGTIISDAGRFTGLTQSVSDAGGVMCIGFVMSLGFLTARLKGFRRTFWLLAMAISAIGLVLSGSVSGLASAIVGTLVLIFCRRFSFKGLAILLLGISIIRYLSEKVQAVQVTALTPWQRFQQAFGVTQGGRYDTVASRTHAYRAAINGFVHNPLVGSGLDPASSITDGQFPAHNLFLGAAYDGGVLLLIVMVICSLRPLVLGGRAAQRTALTDTALGVFFAAISFAMTAPSLFNRYLWLPVAFLLVATYRQNVKSPIHAQRLDEPRAVSRIDMDSAVG